MTSPSVPMTMRGCCAGSSHRSTASSDALGSDTHPAVAPPVETCRKIALPAPGTLPFVVRDHRAVRVRRCVVHRLGVGTRVLRCGIDPLVVEGARGIVVPHDRVARHDAVREPHAGIGLHTEEEVEAVGAGRRPSVALVLRARRREAVVADPRVPGPEHLLPAGIAPLVRGERRGRLAVPAGDDRDHLPRVADANEPIRKRDLDGRRRFGRGRRRGRRRRCRVDRRSGGCRRRRRHCVARDPSVVHRRARRFAAAAGGGRHQRNKQETSTEPSVAAHRPYLPIPPAVPYAERVAACGSHHGGHGHNVRGDRVWRGVVCA